MEKAKQLFRKKKILIPSAVGLVLILAAVIAALILWPAWAGGQNQQESAAQEITLEQLKPFEEQSLLAGVQDYTVGKGETLDWDALLSTDGDIVKSVDVDDSEVDYSTEGDYEITYTVVFDGEKLRHFLEENKSTVAFDANGDQVVVTAVATVTVADEQTDEEAQGSSSESVTSETGEEAQPDEGGTSSPDAGETGQSSTSGTNSGSASQQTPPASNGGSGGNTGTHEHVWVDHVVWVTVEDEPARSEKVTEYRMYYWDTKTWETSEDPNVFNAWQREKIEWMRTYRYENNMPPELFQGYDENGNPVYTNDHTILTYYKTIPAVTHEEEQVDYQYCEDCKLRR